MILKVILIYVVVSQLIVLPWVWWAINSSEQQSAQLDAIKSIPGPRKYIVWTVAFLLQAAAAPFLMPWMVYQMSRCWLQVNEEVSALKSLYMEMSLDPLHSANISDELLEHFETHTPDLMTNGFELLGDFYLKEEPYNSKARLFLGSNQSTFAEIGTTLETQYVELISFFDNGEYASTCSIYDFDKSKIFGKLGIHVNAAGNDDIEELLQSHMEFVDSVSEMTGQAVRKMDFPRWKDYYHYHNHKYGQVRFELGEIAAPPESCVFPPASGESQPQSESPTLR